MSPEPKPRPEPITIEIAPEIQRLDEAELLKQDRMNRAIAEVRAIRLAEERVREQDELALMSKEEDHSSNWNNEL
jgi:hypothetical protein